MKLDRMLTEWKVKKVLVLLFWYCCCLFDVLLCSGLQRSPDFGCTPASLSSAITQPCSIIPLVCGFKSPFSWSVDARATKFPVFVLWLNSSWVFLLSARSLCLSWAFVAHGSSFSALETQIKPLFMFSYARTWSLTVKYCFVSSVFSTLQSLITQNAATLYALTVFKIMTWYFGKYRCLSWAICRCGVWKCAHTHPLTRIYCFSVNHQLAWDQGQDRTEIFF